MVQNTEHLTDVAETTLTTTTAPEGEVTTDELKKDVQQITPEELRKTVREYLNMPEVKKNLLTWAEKIHERTRGNWFDFEYLIKKTPLKNHENAKAVLDFMIMAGLCHRKIADKGVIKFKITLRKEDKIQLLKQQADDLQNQREAILREIEVLSAEAAEVAA